MLKNNTKQICFIANYDKTYFFDKIAQELKKQGIIVYWIVVNEFLNNFLVENYGKEKILYLNKSIDKRGPISEYKINELVQGDRILRKDREKGKNFLVSIQSLIYSFLNTNKVSFVFGELTWAHEVLIHRICSQNKELNCKFLNPHTIRIPNGRFAFFEDEFQSTLYAPTQNHNRSERFIKIEKPDYLKLNNNLIANRKKLSYKLKVLKRFVLNQGYYDRCDPTLHENKFYKLTLKFSEKRKIKAYFKIKRVSVNFLNNKKFILFFLHKQPEASVDVFGRYYENQLQSIERLWRILPNDWYLVIKEHTNAIGDRDKSFYKKVLSYPNTVFVDEKADSHKLIKSCEAVFTITGTVAYEAALLNKQSFTFVPTFFNQFSCCHRMTIEDFRDMNSLESFIEGKKDKISPLFDRDLQANILRDSFSGIISDPISNNECTLDENILEVVKAFRKVINE